MVNDGEVVWCCVWFWFFDYVIDVEQIVFDYFICDYVVFVSFVFWNFLYSDDRVVELFVQCNYLCQYVLFFVYIQVVCQYNGKWFIIDQFFVC